MSSHNIGFYEEISKIITELSSISSNTHFISSADLKIQKQRYWSAWVEAQLMRLLFFAYANSRFNYDNFLLS